MISAVLIRALWLLASLMPTAGTTITGKLVEGISGEPVGGDDAFVVVYVELPGYGGDTVILGYTHPDAQGKWTISNLPAAGKVFLAGFHRGYPLSLFHDEISLTGGPSIDVGTKSMLTATPAERMKGSAKPTVLPHLLMNRRNEDVAKELIRLISAGNVVAGTGIQGEPLSIDGLWERSGRTYRISGSKAEIVDVGTTLKSTAASGDEVMRNITRTGANTWTAEVLWQKESEKKWAKGTLSLSPDGRVLTRICPSPWNEVEEVVRFNRK